MLVYFGVKNYGKSRVSSRFGVCMNCRAAGSLTSYTTAKFFYLYWIPLIPVGHERAIDECSSCGHAHVASARLAGKTRKQAIERVFNALNKEPGNVERIRETMQLLARYGEEETFRRLALTYKEKMPNEARVRLETANGFYSIGCFEDAATYAQEAKILGAGEEADELIENIQSAAAIQQRSGGRERAKSGIPILIPYLVPLLIIASVLGSMLFTGFSAGQAHPIWLVNGTKKAYELSIDGKAYQLPPYYTVNITLPMGNHTAQIENSALPMDPVAFNNHIPFADRIFESTLQVLNPDGMAFLIETGMPYISDSASQAAEATYDYHAGSFFYALEDIDYPFRDSPENIEISAGVSVVYKQQLDLYTPETYTAQLNLMNETTPDPDLSFFAEQCLRIDPASEESQLMLRLASGTNSIESLSYLQAGLEFRPVLIEWHRTYQSAKEAIDPTYDLESEYEMLLDQDPDNGALKYLLARLTVDQNKAQRLYLESEKTEDATGYGYNAIAYEMLCRSRYPEALNYAGMAIEKDPEHENFSDTHTEALYALKEHAALLEIIRKEQDKAPDNGILIASETRILCQLGRLTEARQAEQDYYNANADWMNAEQRKEWSHYFDAVRAYVKRDIPKYLEEMNTIDPARIIYERSLRGDDPQQALEILKQDESTDFTAYLLTYCAAHHARSPETAAEAIELATMQLAYSPETAALFNEGTDPEDLKALDVWPDTKRVLACALAISHPEYADGFHQIAQTCNYKPIFPQDLIEQWIAR